ncbi:MAG: chemotaxis protein CheW [Candidatus Rokubacteria bacterium]|nr:chemotaxis protein CheW [Candidatus Rokubacteria bacterium]
MSPRLRVRHASDRGSARAGVRTLPARGHVIVGVGGLEYAFDARRVRHLLPASTADLANGEVRFLGRSYPVRDLRGVLRAVGPAPLRRFLLIVEGERQHVAFVVDAVTALLRVDAGAVLPLPAAFVGRERRRFAGLVRRQDRVVPLLDVDGVVE